MGTINDKNGRDLVDAEEIKKRWKEYMEFHIYVLVYCIGVFLSGLLHSV